MIQPLRGGLVAVVDEGKDHGEIESDNKEDVENDAVDPNHER
jgi:hypothetical protein